MVKKIMVVDDEKDITIAIKEGLEELEPEYQVITVNTGEECLERLKNEKVDLVLLDIMMPGMSGWEVLNRLQDHNEWSKIPLVFLTAKTDNFTKTFGKTVTMDFIEKPFDIVDLKNRLDIIFKKINQKYPEIV